MAGYLISQQVLADGNVDRRVSLVGVCGRRNYLGSLRIVSSNSRLMAGYLMSQQVLADGNVEGELV